MTNVVQFRTRLRTDLFCAKAQMDKVRQNKLMKGVMDKLAAAGWTFELHPLVGVVCQHPQVISFKPLISLADAQRIQAISERKTV